MKIYNLMLSILSIQFFICVASVAQSNSDYDKATPLTIEDYIPSFITDVLKNANNLIISDEGAGLINININASQIDKQIVRRGRGPGEFEFISDIHLGKHSKKLLLLDSRLFRVSFYTSDSLDFLDSFVLPNVTNTGDEVGTFSPR